MQIPRCVERKRALEMARGLKKELPLGSSLMGFLLRARCVSQSLAFVQAELWPLLIQ
jgi:hypothetical protein